MRITTQMLAHSAAKSGIPFQQTTLLDILNKKSSFSGLLNGVNASADATAIAKKKNYSKLEDISGNLNGKGKRQYKGYCFLGKKNGRELQRNVKTAQGNRGYFK